MLIPIHKKGTIGKPQSESSVVISGPNIYIPAGNYKEGWDTKGEPLTMEFANVTLISK